MESEVKTINIPVVKYKDFQFPYRRVTEDELVDLNPEGGRLDPTAVVREMRAHRRELGDQISLLFAALTLVDNPEMKEMLTNLGLVISDVHKRQFFPEEEIPQNN